MDNTISGLEDAIVTGGSEKGTWSRLFDSPIEGKLIQRYEGLDVGDPVRVELIRPDAERRFIDLALAGRGQGDEIRLPQWGNRSLYRT